MGSKSVISPIVMSKRLNGPTEKGEGLVVERFARQFHLSPFLHSQFYRFESGGHENEMGTMKKSKHTLKTFRRRRMDG